MTELLDYTVKAMQNLSPDMQDALARMVLQIMGEGQPVLQMTDEDAASFDESLSEEMRGTFATDEQISAIWAKHGL